MAVFPVICRRARAGWLAILAFALVPLTLAQQPEQKQEIPDAPSTVHPPQPFPNAAPESKPAPPNQTPPGEANPENAPAPAAEAPPPRPPMNFTTDPFALSAAVIFDTGLPDVALEKVKQTFPALEGAFSQFDEVSIYTYSSAVSKVSDFSAAGKQLTATLNELKTVSGRNNGPPVTGGPLGPQGPTVNNVPIDPSTPRVITPPKESHVLNDAILAAAVDLRRRDRTRRKVIFIISDGRESRSIASYSDTLKVLLSYNIMVYGVAVESSAAPIYGRLQRLHLPKLGYSDILPKYASATGGEVFNGFSRQAIESTYAQLIGDARNQYTLGYVTRATPSSAHREIEVKVARPDLTVVAKEGYYPVGLAR